jgi:phosphoadenosine phosphosulfate reductase
LFEGTTEAVEATDRAEPTATRLAALTLRYEGASTGALLRGMLGREFPGRIALVSSFGIESAVILSLVAEIDPATPVIFLDTGKHFPQTLAYRDTLIERLGLTDVRSVEPDPALAAAVDPDGGLSQRAPDHCCFLRKVEPLDRALDGFAAWITGRKRFQGGERQALPHLEEVDGRIKINPLVDWSPQDVATVFRTPRPAAASARPRRLPLDRLRALHASHGIRQGRALRPLGRARQDRMRHPQPAPGGCVADRSPEIAASLVAPSSPMLR